MFSLQSEFKQSQFCHKRALSTNKRSRNASKVHLGCFSFFSFTMQYNNCLFCLVFSTNQSQHLSYKRTFSRWAIGYLLLSRYSMSVFKFIVVVFIVCYCKHAKPFKSMFHQRLYFHLLPSRSVGWESLCWNSRCNVDSTVAVIHEQTCFIVSATVQRRPISFPWSMYTDFIGNIYLCIWFCFCFLSKDKIPDKAGLSSRTDLCWYHSSICTCSVGSPPTPHPFASMVVTDKEITGLWG